MPFETDYWENTGVDFLDSILFNQNLDLLPEDELLTQPPLNNVSGSVCSDSGLSSDQQMSPLSFESTDEHDNSLSNDMNIDPLALLNTSFPQVEEPTKEEDDEEEEEIKEEVIVESKPVVRVKPSVSRNTSRILNISSIQNNPRSILIPVKGRNGLKTIKIIKTTGRNVPKPQSIKIEPSFEEARSSSDDTGDESEQTVNNIYPRLKLTDEEKRLMVKEGITLPSHYPLTKQEERDLKRIRRKIRNKISAQDSRKRKKEYVDGLEDRVKQCSAENANLMKRVKALQNENQCLSAQLKRLQAVIARSTPQQAQPATCLMVLVLSLALIMAPNMRSTTKSTSQNDISIPDAKTSSLGRSRTLLEVHKQVEGGFLEPPLDGLTSDEEEEEGGIFSELAELLHFRASPSQHDHDYTNPRVRKRSRAFVVPPVDDNWPPPKRPYSPQNIEYVYFNQKNKTRPESPSNIVEIELTSSVEEN
ncbi:cyclic AMP-responsive element-binding protein 3-like protein 1 isoform X2 [Cimex lectularius]|uniref:BZIP domain-containing protein n=1 Tax=Cimex lectularius TaxID=79782 RepID=A0A8I6RRN4_CIMLE|nr:cyclic AMP-responsive element-binding protein 3-like protein 1 isoform X2 [Cimex lectularius]